MKNLFTKFKKLKLKYILGIVGLGLPLIALSPYYGLYIFIALSPFVFFFAYAVGWSGFPVIILVPLIFLFSGIYYLFIGIVISNIKKDQINVVVLALCAIAHIITAYYMIEGVRNFSW